MEKDAEIVPDHQKGRGIHGLKMRFRIQPHCWSLAGYARLGIIMVYGTANSVSYRGHGNVAEQLQSGNNTKYGDD